MTLTARLTSRTPVASLLSCLTMSNVFSTQPRIPAAATSDTSVQNSSFTRSDRSHDENPLERAGCWAAPGLKNSTEFTLTSLFAPCVLTSISGFTSTSVSSSPLSNVNTLVVSKLVVGGAFAREKKTLPGQNQNNIKVREIKIKTGMLPFGRALVVAGITGTVHPTEGTGAFPEHSIKTSIITRKTNK